MIIQASTFRAQDWALGVSFGLRSACSALGFGLWVLVLGWVPGSFLG